MTNSALVRVDLGEYTDMSSVAGLIGSRPGLVGSDEGDFLPSKSAGLLTRGPIR